MACPRTRHSPGGRAPVTAARPARGWSRAQGSERGCASATVCLGFECRSWSLKHLPMNSLTLILASNSPPCRTGDSPPERRPPVATTHQAQKDGERVSPHATPGALRQTARRLRSRHSSEGGVLSLAWPCVPRRPHSRPAGGWAPEGSAPSALTWLGALSPPCARRGTRPGRLPGAAQAARGHT